MSTTCTLIEHIEASRRRNQAVLTRLRSRRVCLKHRFKTSYSALATRPQIEHQNRDAMGANAPFSISVRAGTTALLWAQLPSTRVQFNELIHGNSDNTNKISLTSMCPASPRMTEQFRLLINLFINPTFHLPVGYFFCYLLGCVFI